jgi:hypothetical protein
MALMALLQLSFSTCKNDIADTTNNHKTTTVDSIPSAWIKIGETYTLGNAAKVVVYSEIAITTGYNKLYIAVYDSITGERLNDGHIDIDAIMQMGADTHRAFSENEGLTSHSDKLWKANLYFTMPDSTNKWVMHVTFHNHKNNIESEGEFHLNVGTISNPVITSFADSMLNNRMVYLAMIQPQKPFQGSNDFECIAFQQFANDSFIPVNDYQLTMTPIMLSMGHSSPNNVQPVSIGNGHYNGDVVFTMSGKWRIFLTVKRNNVMIKDSAYFDTVF